MIKNFKNKIKANFKILNLISIVAFTIIFTIFFIQSQKKSAENYDNILENIYLKKTLKHLVNNLEPKYKRINHRIKSGETFDKILSNYSIDKEEITIIKETLKKKINLNKLNTKQSIHISIDQTNNRIVDFFFQISNTEKILLSRNNDNKKFNEKIIILELDKKIIYEENKILQSLYKAATDKNIPATRCDSVNVMLKI